MVCNKLTNRYYDGMKATSADGVVKFTDIPNVGPRIAHDFVTIGIKNPAGLKGKDALVLYKKLCKVTGARHDPCVLDTFMAVTDFMNGAPAKPWWAYTSERKHSYPNI
jgi:hypothetical protein